MSSIVTILFIIGTFLILGFISIILIIIKNPKEVKENMEIAKIIKDSIIITTTEIFYEDDN